MRNTFDFNNEFPVVNEFLCQDSSKLHINVHPEFEGIYLCYFQAFKSLKNDLSQLLDYSEIHVWQDQKIPGYLIANACQVYLCLLQNPPKDSKIFMHKFPQQHEKLALLKREVSLEFLIFLSSYPHDLNRVNPEKLLSLINRFISPEAILILNKQYSYKPHYSMSLQQLAKLLSFSPHQLNYRKKILQAKKQSILVDLQKNSQMVRQYIKNPDFDFSAGGVCKSK